MAKPSIFSNEYERHMRRRRKNIGILICILVIASIVFLFIKFKGLNYNNINFLNKIKNINVENKGKKQAAVKISNSINDEDNIYLIKVNGKDVKVTYDNRDKKIKSLDLNGLDGEYNISPSEKFALIYNKTNQTMNLINSDGNNEDISYNIYVSSHGSSFNRENEIKSNSSYLWCFSPKFMDDDNIVFVSQIPWFDNRPNKYIWIYNLKNKSYINTNITGIDVKINAITDKGIEINMDGNKRYLKNDGSMGV